MANDEAVDSGPLTFDRHCHAVMGWLGDTPFRSTPCPEKATGWSEVDALGDTESMTAVTESASALGALDEVGDRIDSAVEVVPSMSRTCEFKPCEW